MKHNDGDDGDKSEMNDGDNGDLREMNDGDNGQMSDGERSDGERSDGERSDGAIDSEVEEDKEHSSVIIKGLLYRDEYHMQVMLLCMSLFYRPVQRTF